MGEGVVGGIIITGLVASGPVGIVVAGGLSLYGGYQIGTNIAELVDGRGSNGEELSEDAYGSLAAQTLGGLVSMGVTTSGYNQGDEIVLDSCRGTNGKPARIAPWGNRTGNPYGELPHYHYGKPDPANPGESLPGQNGKKHRPWQGGF